MFSFFFFFKSLLSFLKIFTMCPPLLTSCRHLILKDGNRSRNLHVLAHLRLDRRCLFIVKYVQAITAWQNNKQVERRLREHNTPCLRNISWVLTRLIRRAPRQTFYLRLFFCLVHTILRVVYFYFIYFLTCAKVLLGNWSQFVVRLVQQ